MVAAENRREVIREGKLAGRRPTEEKGEKRAVEARQQFAHRARQANVPLPSLPPDIPDELRDAIRYLWNNADRMDYAHAIQDGLPIGSGTVEASCKTLVTVRMKRCGARWKRDGAQAILNLRSLATSSLWSEGFEIIRRRYPATVHEVA